jgi:hypothetical protein
MTQTGHFGLVSVRPFVYACMSACSPPCRWEWAGSGGREVAAWGWAEPPEDSPAENCLAWSVSSQSSYWHGSSCCNNLRYICRLR